MSTISPLDPARLNDLRARVLAGEEFPAEEYRQIIQGYRALRLAGTTASAAKTAAKVASAAKAAPVDLSVLMAGIGLAPK